MAFFKSRFESGFQQASFQVLCFLFNNISFYQQSFCLGLSSRKNQRQGFSALVSVSVSFDWLCFVASVLFVVGFVGSQNRRVFFSKVSGKLSL